MSFKPLFIFSLWCMSAVLYGQDIKVMSYNIKYDNTRDTVNNWNDRKEPMVALLKKHDPAFIGMQEVLVNQLRYLDHALPNYNYIGVGRDDGKEKGEFSPILYDSKKYNLLESHTFWLSKTPETISVGWDASMERICTYGLFEDKKTNARLWVFNTHFDHIGNKARKNSATLILKKIKQINTENLPVVLMGDFNLTPETKPITSLKKSLKDSKDFSKTAAEGPVGTFNGFNLSDPITNRIDYVFVKGFNVKSYAHINERITNGKHISDHLPVLVELITE